MPATQALRAEEAGNQETRELPQLTQSRPEKKRGQPAVQGAENPRL